MKCDSARRATPVANIVPVRLATEKAKVEKVCPAALDPSHRPSLRSHSAKGCEKWSSWWAAGTWGRLTLVPKVHCALSVEGPGEGRSRIGQATWYFAREHTLHTSSQAVAGP
jgi:hypothetical protein